MLKKVKLKNPISAEQRDKIQGCKPLMGYNQHTVDGAFCASPGTLSAYDAMKSYAEYVQREGLIGTAPVFLLPNDEGMYMIRSSKALKKPVYFVSMELVEKQTKSSDDSKTNEQPTPRLERQYNGILITVSTHGERKVFTHLVDEEDLNQEEFVVTLTSPDGKYFNYFSNHNTIMSFLFEKVENLMDKLKDHVSYKKMAKIKLLLKKKPPKYKKPDWVTLKLPHERYGEKLLHTQPEIFQLSETGEIYNPYTNNTIRSTILKNRLRGKPGKNLKVSWDTYNYIPSGNYGISIEDLLMYNYRNEEWLEICDNNQKGLYSIYYYKNNNLTNNYKTNSSGQLVQSFTDEELTRQFHYSNLGYYYSFISRTSDYGRTQRVMNIKVKCLYPHSGIYEFKTLGDFFTWYCEKYDRKLSYIRSWFYLRARGLHKSKEGHTPLLFKPSYSAAIKLLEISGVNLENWPEKRKMFIKS